MAGFEKAIMYLSDVKYVGTYKYVRSKKPLVKKMKIIVSASCLKYEHRQQGREKVKG